MITKIKYVNDVDPSSNSVLTIDKNMCSGWSNKSEGSFLANSKTLDKSINNSNPLTENGTITESPVATGAELMAYSGFSATNYLRLPANVLDVNSKSFNIMLWYKSSSETDNMLIHTGDAGVVGGVRAIHIVGDLLSFSAWSTVVNSAKIVADNLWHFISVSVVYISGTDYMIRMYADGELVYNDTLSMVTFTNTAWDIGGTDITAGNAPYNTIGSLSLVRLSLNVPSSEQIKEIYESEKHLFTDNTKCTLSSANSSVVNALAYDDDTNLLHAAGSSNLDTFDGLVRIDSEVGSYTSLSANTEMVVKGS